MNGQNEKIKLTFEETIMVSTELTIYFTNVFTIEIVQRENERNRGKINYNLENINKVIFLELLKKKTNEMGRSQTMNERNEKPNATIYAMS